MISFIFLLISIYIMWYYRSFKNENEPSWAENNDLFVFAAIPEIILEVVILIAYLSLKG